jgi:hypothetical protein
MSPTELTTDVVAVAAVASPWWLPSLAQVHDGAAWVLPLLGCLWLLLQIGGWLFAKWR